VSTVCSCCFAISSLVTYPVLVVAGQKGRDETLDAPHPRAASPSKSHSLLAAWQPMLCSPTSQNSCWPSRRPSRRPAASRGRGESLLVVLGFAVGVTLFVIRRPAMRVFATGYSSAHGMRLQLVAACRCLSPAHPMPPAWGHTFEAFVLSGSRSSYIGPAQRHQTIDTLGILGYISDHNTNNSQSRFSALV
jgi:hypothetical protein